jgi:hypothetical protein
MTHAASTQPHDADRYEIRVQGRLDPRWSTYLDGVHLRPGTDGTTVLTGRVVDQAALHGLLAGLRDLGVPLISVALLDPGRAHPHHDTTGEPT